MLRLWVSLRLWPAVSGRGWGDPQERLCSGVLQLSCKAADPQCSATIHGSQPVTRLFVEARPWLSTYVLQTDPPTT